MSIFYKLIGEQTHVWQVQQGIKVIRRAVIDRRYQYLLQAGKSFAQYGVEQQAQMVQDFFVQRSLGQDCRALQACLPFFKANWAGALKPNDKEPKL